MARTTLLICLIGALALVNSVAGSSKWIKPKTKGNTGSKNVGSAFFKNTPDIQRTQSLPAFPSRKINSDTRSPKGFLRGMFSSSELDNKGKGVGNKKRGGFKSTWKKIELGASVLSSVAGAGAYVANVFLPETSDGVLDNEQIFRDIACPGQEITTSMPVGDVTYKPFDVSGMRLEDENIQLNKAQRGNEHFVVVGAVTTNTASEIVTFTRSYVLYFEGNTDIASYSCHEIDGRKLLLTEGTNQSNDSEYITLTKGQLVPKYDFVGAAKQKQTNVNENSVPQWSSINKGNWNLVERAVRDLAQSKRMKLNVVTGTWGVFQRKRGNNKSNSDTLVPALFWKLVYDPQTRTGVVIFVSNNPFHSLQELDIKPCSQKSVCSNLDSWLKFNNKVNNVTNGETVCCKINAVNSALKLHQIINVYNHAGLLK